MLAMKNSRFVGNLFMFYGCYWLQTTNAPIILQSNRPNKWGNGYVY